MEKNIVPIVFAVDDNYAPFLSVTLNSIFCNCSKDFYYKIYVLTDGLSEENKKNLSIYNTEISSVEYLNVKKNLEEIKDLLYLRDYFSNATYYRFFIPSLLPQYDKVLYLDSDLIVLDDISKLFFTDLENNYAGAVMEEVMSLVDVFGNYVEKGLGINRANYFNAGVMLLNLKALREISLLEKFSSLISKFIFKVTQDQDYLNVILKDKVKFLDLGWNKCPMKNDDFDCKNLKIIHFKLHLKPWLYDQVNFGEYFWEYANKSNSIEYIKKVKQNYGKDNIAKDLLAYKKLMRLACDYVKDDNCFYKVTGGKA